MSPYFENMQVGVNGKNSVMYYRPGTVDDFIINQVFRHNEYQLPDNVNNANVIDIGGHIGSFSVRMALSGAARIEVYEPLQSNFDLLVRNTKKFTNIFPTKAAVWRSDVAYPMSLFTDGPTIESTKNTGDANVMFHNEGNVPIEVNAISLDSIIGDRYINLLKLDCESSEWPILYTSTKLAQCQFIVGEFHEVSGLFDTNGIMDHAHIMGASFTMPALVAYLGSIGFDTNYQRFMNPDKTWSNMGLFYSYNTRWSN